MNDHRTHADTAMRCDARPFHNHPYWCAKRQRRKDQDLQLFVFRLRGLFSRCDEENRVRMRASDTESTYSLTLLENTEADDVVDDDNADYHTREKKKLQIIEKRLGLVWSLSSSSFV